MKPSQLVIKSVDDIEQHLDAIHDAAERAHAWIKSHSGTATELFHALKFDAVGFHPIHRHALNIIEQVNQSATFLAALEGTRFLLERHPEAGGYVLAPGAHMAQPLDIMSIFELEVGAEVFAAVSPNNNQKLRKDLDKMAVRPERHRYVLFASPRYPDTARQTELERNTIQVWSIATRLTRV